MLLAVFGCCDVDNTLKFAEKQKQKQMAAEKICKV